VSPTLPEPIVISRWWKNRGGEAVCVRLGDHRGRTMIDVRTWAVDRDGILRPSHKGIALSVRHLPVLFKAIAKAYATARAHGLIDKTWNDGSWQKAARDYHAERTGRLSLTEKAEEK
jgi:hypothetical protein